MSTLSQGFRLLFLGAIQRFSGIFQAKPLDGLPQWLIFTTSLNGYGVLGFSLQLN